MDNILSIEEKLITANLITISINLTTNELLKKPVKF